MLCGARGGAWPGLSHCLTRLKELVKFYTKILLVLSATIFVNYQTKFVFIMCKAPVDQLVQNNPFRFHSTHDVSCFLMFCQFC
jgi:hypothetical protein